MTPASKTSRVQRLEKTIKELIDQLNEKTRTLAALEADFDHMVYVVKDFTKKYKQSQSTDEVKSDDLDQQRKALLDKDYEDSPPYILVFHGLQRDWMEQVNLVFKSSSTNASSCGHCGHEECYPAIQSSRDHQGGFSIGLESQWC